MSRISVAMCTYNGEKFLHEQLASLANQTRLPDELVICDDGSTDSTAEIVEEFARTVSFPMRFIRNPENLGSTKNFEKAIGLCTGDLIALCDQDDIWMPEKLARQADVMENDPELGGVFSDGEVVDDRSEPLSKRVWQSAGFSCDEQRSFRRGQSTAILTRKNVVTGTTLTIRASLLPLLLPVPAPWVHDAWIAWMLVLDSKLDFIETPLVRYRLHASQQIGLVTISEQPLLKRLQSSRYEGPARRAEHLKELLMLERHLAGRDDFRAREMSASLRRKIKFLEDRKIAEGKLFSSAVCVLRNRRNYRRFENGWKSMARDLASIFIWPRVAP